MTGFFLLIVLLICSLTWKIFSSYESDRKTARSQTKNFVQAMGAHVVGALQIIDLSLANYAEGIKGLSTDSPPSPEAIRQLLLTSGRLSDANFWVIFIDPQGRGVAASNNLPISGVSYADRPYFSTHVSNASSGLFIGAPEIGRVSKRRLFFLSRRVTSATGKFLGVVASPVDASAFATVFENALFQPSLSITLAHTDGKIIARAPKFDESFASNIVGSTLFKKLAIAPSGTYEAKSLIDGDTRIFSYKTIENMPLVVSVGMASQSWVDGLVDDMLVAIAALVVIIAVLIFSGKFALSSFKKMAISEGNQRQLSEQLTVSESRFRLITDSMPALIGYVDQYERYRFSNQAYFGLTGIAHEKIIGMTIREVFGEENYRLMGGQIKAALNGKAVSFERKTVMKDGKTTYFQCEYIPERASDGQITGFYVMALNISDRQLAEQRLAESERRLRAITDNIPALVAHIGKDQEYLFVNPHYRVAFGKDMSKMIGQTMAHEHPPDLYADLLPYVARVLAGETLTFEGKARAYGLDAYYQSTYVPDLNENSDVIGFFAMTFDITATKKSEMVQAAAEKRLRTITDNLPVLITYIDNQRTLRFANKTMQGWLGIAPDQAINRLFKDVFGPTIYAERKTHIDQVLTGKHVKFDIVGDVAGVTRYMQAEYLPDIGADGTVHGFYSLTSDVSTLKASEQRLALLAKTDTLTGLASRHQFNEHLASAVVRQQRSGQPMAVMFLDIDHFKGINDSFGHATGDMILVEFSRRLVSTVRITDTVARLAGDEFVVILEGLHTKEEATGVAEKILRAMALPFTCGALQRQVGTSIGIAYAEWPGETPEQLLDRADKGLYIAKSRGRGTFAEELPLLV